LLGGRCINPLNLRDAAEIDHAVATFARSLNGGLIVTTGATATRDRGLIFVIAGGLISYGPDFADQYRRAVGYVDRILKSEKPADLPVQMSTKYQLVINLKTAKTLDVTIPPSVLARADEVIE